MEATDTVIKEIIAELIFARSEEANYIDDSVLQFKSYCMALEDLWYRLTGKELDLGQDVDTPEIEADF